MCTHTHSRSHTHNLRSRCIFFCGAASAGRHAGLMAQAQAAYWWADLASIHFTQTFLCQTLTLSFTLSQHTHKNTRHVSGDASKEWRLCATGQNIKKWLISSETLWQNLQFSFSMSLLFFFPLKLLSKMKSWWNKLASNCTSVHFHCKSASDRRTEWF